MRDAIYGQPAAITEPLQPLTCLQTRSARARWGNALTVRSVCPGIHSALYVMRSSLAEAYQSGTFDVKLMSKVKNICEINSQTPTEFAWLSITEFRAGPTPESMNNVLGNNCSREKITAT